MNSEAVMSAPISRPKIHRLPGNASSSARKRFPLKVPAFNRHSWALMILALVLVGVYMVSAERLENTAKNTLQAPISDAMAHVPAPDEQGDTIVLTGQKGTIVGQMAKIPAKNEQITEIETVSEVDKGDKQDLLSIVGQH